MIKLENISKYYYSANSVVPALRKIKLEFKKGEFVAITGESGGGKSTLLNIISGFDTYDEGELYINGEATSLFDDDDWEEYRKNKIGFVYQNYSLIENYSAIYNVESSLLIQGYDNKEARKIAKELLIKVGLKNKENQKASKLSNGQKQRLSIARALAKNTDIIVADEPTGNLDSESGRQIMELFGELSKDRLIIIVTHNYEETTPYVTRKIRLHDGEIAADVLVKNTASESIACDNESQDCEELSASKNNNTRGNRPNKVSGSKTAWRFTRMNITTQPRRAALFLCFLLFTSLISFIFLGEIYSNMDDTFTKDYDNRAFLNGNNTRIVVKRPDGKAITDADIKTFQKINYVEMADRYDYANDINYYITLGKDYDYAYQSKDGVTKTSRLKIVTFLQSTKFMKSITCISEKDLRAGRLPKARNEVVLYSKDKRLLNQEQNCYFTSQNMWGNDNYYSTKVKVVGLLREISDQVYFSGKLCSMLSAELYGDDFKLDLSKNALTHKYNLSQMIIPVIADDLKEGEIRVSQDLVNSSVYTIPGEAQITIYSAGEDSSEKGSGNSYDAVILKKYSPHSTKLVEVSPEWFKEHCSYDSNQTSLYIKDYIYTDAVLNELKSMGYQAISSYRISSVNYNQWKVNQRNTTLQKSFLILLVLCLLEILILGAFLKIKYNNMLVLTSMGMKQKTINKINYYEMLLYTIVSVSITVAAVTLLKLSGLEFWSNLEKYFNLSAYAVFVAYNIMVILITVGLFNRYFRRRQEWNWKVRIS